MQNRCYLGTAGWSLSKENKVFFPVQKPQLSAYAQRLNAVEINSSFYHPHRPATYEKWALSVPSDFRFSVKAPRTVTHERRLKNTDSLMLEFLSGVLLLKEKLGVILLQFPPSFSFEPGIVKNFLDAFREKYAGKIAVEPRHLTWFSDEAMELLRLYDACAVIADPPMAKRDPSFLIRFPFQYFRLHGSPKRYYSNYDPSRLLEFSDLIRAQLAQPKEVWCIFDNTAEGFAVKNALEIQSIIER